MGMRVYMGKMYVVNVSQDNMLLDLHHQMIQLKPQVANCVKLVDTEQLFQHRNVLTKMMHVIYVRLEDILQLKVQIVQINAINVLPAKRILLQVLFQVMLVLIAIKMNIPMLVLLNVHFATLVK